METCTNSIMVNTVTPAALHQELPEEKRHVRRTQIPIRCRYQCSSHRQAPDQRQVCRIQNDYLERCRQSRHPGSAGARAIRHQRRTGRSHHRCCRGFQDLEEHLNWCPCARDVKAAGTYQARYEKTCRVSHRRAGQDHSGCGRRCVPWAGSGRARVLHRHPFAR